MDGSLEALLRVDPAALSGEERLDHLERVHALAARVDAAREKALAALHDPDDRKRWVREEVAAALNWSSSYAQARLVQAAHVTAKLPGLFALHEAGRISAAHLRAAAEGTYLVPDRLIGRIEAQVLARVPNQTVPQFRASLRRAVAREDPRSFEDRHAQAVKAEKGVRISPLPDGLAGIWSVHDAVTAEAIFAQLTDHAYQSHGAVTGTDADDGQTLDARRADALAALVLGTDGTGGPARRVLVQLLVPAATAAGADDAPGELAGHGPVPASLCRAVVAEPSTTVQPIRLDAAGRVIADTGLDTRRHHYQPSAAQVRHVRAAWRTCRFPTCTRRAISCECDHLVPFSGHNTTVANLQPLCARHHHLKHETDWAAWRDRWGTTHWRSPRGREYRKPPDELPGDDPPLHPGRD